MINARQKVKAFGRWLLGQPWMVTFLLLRVVEAVMFAVRFPNSRVDTGVYAANVALSFGFWLVVGLLYGALDERKSLRIRAAKHALGASMAIFTVLLIASSIAAYRHFGEFVTPDMLVYLSQNPSWIDSYLQTAMLGVWGICGLGALLALLALWKPRSTNRSGWRLISRQPLVSILLAVVAFFPAYLVFDTAAASYPLYTSSMDSALAMAIEDFTSVEREQHQLHQSVRTPPKKVEPLADHAPTVILFLYESWGRQSLSFYGGERTPMPFLADWLDRDQDQFLRFERAFSNSTATDVSVPSILTGVAPWAPADKLHRMPFMWDWAKAAGMKTVLVSSKSYNFANFNHFFFSPGPDQIITRDTLGYEPVNDIGFDEIVAAKKVAEVIKHAPAEQPLFIVYFNDALHPLFQTRSSELDEQPTFANPYENGLYIVDAGLERVHQALAQTERLDDSLLIFTGDHGMRALNSNAHPPSRLQSPFDEFIHIPLLIHLPKRWLQSRPKQVDHLRAATRKNVSNLDLLPTLADLWGVDGPPENARRLETLEGRSLAEPTDPDRLLMMTNCSDIRRWSKPALALIRGDKRFVYDAVDGAGFYEVSDDPEQRHNLWSQLPPLEQRSWLKIVADNRLFRELVPPALLEPVRSERADVTTAGSGK